MNGQEIMLSTKILVGSSTPSSPIEKFASNRNGECCTSTAFYARGRMAGVSRICLSVCPGIWNANCPMDLLWQPKQ